MEKRKVIQMKPRVDNYKIQAAQAKKLFLT